jgi:hypothetical protein
MAIVRGPCPWLLLPINLCRCHHYKQHLRPDFGGQSKPRQRRRRRQIHLPQSQSRIGPIHNSDYWCIGYGVSFIHRRFSHQFLRAGLSCICHRRGRRQCDSRQRPVGSWCDVKCERCGCRHHQELWSSNSCRMASPWMGVHARKLPLLLIQGMCSSLAR